MHRGKDERGLSGNRKQTWKEFEKQIQKLKQDEQIVLGQKLNYEQRFVSKDDDVGPGAAAAVVAAGHAPHRQRRELPAQRGVRILRPEQLPGPSVQVGAGQLSSLPGLGPDSFCEEVAQNPAKSSFLCKS
jgi:hypothetical protein